jgi:hypothetical protein
MTMTRINGLFAPIIAATIAVASPSLALAEPLPRGDFGEPNGGLGWQTREPTLFCYSYFAIREAQQAARAQDGNWLKELKCGFVPGGIKLTVIPEPPSALTETEES